MSKISEIENDNITDKNLERFLAELELYAVPQGRSKELAWDSIVQKIENTQLNGKPRTILFPIKAIMSLAATVLILIAGWFLYHWFDAKLISVPNGTTVQIELPDQSVVKLNSASSIQYSRFNWNSNRHVKLTGEAFFEVKKGKPFVVESNGNKITVLGTGFNVYSRNDRFEVFCFSGKVKVNIRNTDSVVLVKGDAVVLSKDTGEYSTISFDTAQAARWRSGEYYFDRKELKTVFEELERQFNVAIHTPDLGKRFYSGYFKNTNLDEALQNVCLPMGIKYTIIDSTNVVIKTE